MLPCSRVWSLNEKTKADIRVKKITENQKEEKEIE